VRVDDEEYERLLFEQLRIIHEAHAKAAKPILDRIAELRSRQLRPFFVSMENIGSEQLERLRNETATNYVQCCENLTSVWTTASKDGVK
jgi:hypothetical protein